MKVNELRDLSIDELQQKNQELDEELFRLKLRHTSGQLDSPSTLGQTRKNIARIKTVLRQKEDQ
ncbi:MAG: 50S ribosomal protein L29 [Syntrophales bacterium]|jgi:large subunit ribosomal protein L29|nr:50S ribosomal protein L29 [Syntrophales bacterium]MCK9389996.1 50S ribosomal protein L29 [Syntrophales bacterium]